MESKLQIFLDLITNNRFIILGYHSISNDPLDPWSITPQDFSAQMQLLAEMQMKVFSIDRLMVFFRMRKIPKNSIAITFDDGYTNFLQNGIPILQKHQFPATLYIPVNHIGKKSTWNSMGIEHMLLDWTDLKEITRLGYTIGSHGLNHLDFTNLNMKELTREIDDSKKILENFLGNSVASISCPYSRCGERESMVIEQAGYLFGCGPGTRYGNGLKTNRFLLGRGFIHKSESMKDFLQIIGRKSFLNNRPSMKSTRKYS
jgi:peptidoglycan/xylan/chitin deacetylase (PgdA/CDA1 family)